MISVLCESFPALSPSDAVEEPLGLALHILEMRAYAKAHADRKRWETDPDAEMDITDMTRLIWKVEEYLTKRFQSGQ